MFRAIVLPIFRSIRLCDTAWGIMHPICGRLVVWNAPEDGQNNCPKHVELTGFINKQLLLHPVGCLLYYAIKGQRGSRGIAREEFITLQ
jgi:hypothetical protein